MKKKLLKIALTGDIMLGRLVDQYVVQNLSLPPESIWGNVMPILLEADLRLGNLECVISDKGKKWQPLFKAFHFRASPRAIDILRAASFDCVTLANNHVLDYGPEAFLDCLDRLAQADFPYAGAGPTLKEAIAPAFLQPANFKIAVLALTDNEPKWEATPSKPGINYVAYNERGLLPPYRERIAKAIKQARKSAKFVIVSAHIGPNWGAPSHAIQALAHQLLDLGVDVYWGHSNHTPQGIEIVGKKVILYSTGDFVDDYAVDPVERNDLSFLFAVEMDFQQIQRIYLYPVRIDNFQVRQAKGSEVAFLQKSMKAKCAVFGSTVDFKNGIGTIRVS
jgi:poly-gamma-glutamate synthesis protein (capsule biosynthesis protein)